MTNETISGKLSHFHYYYTTKEPTVGHSCVIHKKDCSLLTDVKYHRRFIGYEPHPLEALSQAQEKFPGDSFILCEQCGEFETSPTKHYNGFTR